MAQKPLKIASGYKKINNNKSTERIFRLLIASEASNT